jgi:hypothetical protein
MKNLVVGTLIGIVLVVLAFVALAPPNLEVYEDGSFTCNSDLPLTRAWKD